MPKTTPRQRKTIGRVMHEFEHGELKSGPEGKAGKVKSRRQAVAIALSEAGASKYQSKKENKERLARAKRKEAAGATAQQEAEGRSHVGARGERESTPAMGGERPLKLKKGAGRPARKPARKTAAGATKEQLYDWAKAQGIEGRSKMSKQELANALR